MGVFHNAFLICMRQNDEFIRRMAREENKRREEERRRQEQEQKAKSESASKTFDPYEVLGVKRGCIKAEARKAYLKKMHEYHPDKVEHLGAELKELAQKKAKEITAAREQIQKHL